MASIEAINLTDITLLDSVAYMNTSQWSEDLVAARMSSAEEAECNCPDGCERDHDND